MMAFSFILHNTVIGMQVCCLFAQPMVLKEVVEHTYDGIEALPHVDSHIDQVVNLSGKGLTTECAVGSTQALTQAHVSHTRL